MTTIERPPIPTPAPTAFLDHDDVGDRVRPPVVPAPLRRWAARGREVFAERWWPTITLLFVLAATATLTSGRGDYVGDNRFEQFWNPARRMAKTLTIWDGSRGLGRVREDFWPATTLPVAALRGLGLNPALAQHLFHALLITMAGAGMVAIVRLFRPRIGIEHLVAGLFMAFGAYSATFLVPSNLYFHYALAPWLFVAMFRGLHEDRPWRWAAIFALLTFAPGNVDTPGLVYNAVPLVSLLVYVVVVERSARPRAAMAWVGRAAALSLLVNTAMLVKTWLAAGALGQRLADTEGAEVSAFTSSWTESLRGLGNWLSYFPEGDTLLKPQGEPYFTNWLVIVCTFVPPCVALFVLWQSRWRVRILYAMIALSSAVVLVGAFPVGNPSPMGEKILDAYSSVKVLTAFRNTYKIGAGLVIGIAALFAYGVVLASRQLQRRGTIYRIAPVALAGVVLAGAAFPFWTGRLYDPGRRFEALPGYWSQTFEHLERLPDDGRSLVLPAISRARYRWGWVGDDIFDALDGRAHAIVTGVPLSTPVAATVLEAVTVVAGDPQYRAGTLAPLMRRLGLTEIVLRNDLDWQELRRPRPSAFDGLRNDPDFQRAAVFGDAGQNTAAPDDHSEAAQHDRAYPPVEIFALRDPVAGLHTTAAQAPLIVAGDGWAWDALTRAGVLDADQPVAYSGELPAELLRKDLDSGAPLLITDTNRRRLRVVLAYEPDYSYTLAAGQDLDRAAQSSWPTEGSQSVAWFPDATAVSLTGSPRSVGGTQAWNRPANAFDGDPLSVWSLRRLDGPVDRTLRVDLRASQDVDSAMFTQLPNAEREGGITRGVLRFSDGTTEPVTLSGRQTTARFTSRRTEFVEFQITDISPSVQTVGLAELSLPGLDLTEHVQAPDDVFRRADADPALAAAVRRAPVAYVFDRSVQTTTQLQPLPALTGAVTNDEETQLRRRFRVLGDHAVDVSGTLRVRNDVPDEVLDRLVGGDHGAYGSARHNGALEGFGGYAFDGDPATAWLAPARAEESLTLRFPRQVVSRVDLSSVYDGASSKIDRFSVEVADPAAPGGVRIVPTPGAASTDAGLGEMQPSDPACDASPIRPPAGCRRTGEIVLDQPIETDHLTIRVLSITGRDAALGGRIRIDEARINGRPNTALHAPDARPKECEDLGTKLFAESTGSARPLPLTIDSTLSDLLAGKPAAVQGCGRMTLTDGWYRLDSGARAPLDQLQLVQPTLLQPSLIQPTLVPSGPSADGPAFTVTERSPTQVTLSIPNNAPGTLLLFNQSWDGGWRAFANGRALGRPRNLNAMNGWVIEEDGPVTVELRYNPRGLFGYSLPATGVGLALCGWLALRRRRADQTAPPATPAPPEIGTEKRASARFSAPIFGGDSSTEIRRRGPGGFDD